MVSFRFSKKNSLGDGLNDLGAKENVPPDSVMIMLVSNRTNFT